MQRKTNQNQVALLEKTNIMSIDFYNKCNVNYVNQGCSIWED